MEAIKSSLFSKAFLYNIYNTILAKTSLTIETKAYNNRVVL